MLRVKLVKSGIDRPFKQKRTLKALGLRKLNSIVVLPNNPQVRGMIDKVKHLVQVEEIDGD
ncbi:50S ribosomal protein L30 [candidate division WOR-3 bacterium]|nr:50S ribosomal protein L30 [candidate division WOR-3 bacterium]